MTKRIRIGNQTASSAAEPMAPFGFALAQGFDAFEWFSDKKQYDDGTWSGWGFDDMGQPERASIARTGEEGDVLYTVHAPWQANPLYAQGPELLLESLDFARDIGADLVNLHLYTEQGIEVFLERVAPVVSYAAERGVRIALENTPLATPADFRDFFTRLSQSELEDRAVGMCLDIGHANLCKHTRNDFIRYLDELGPGVPIIHAHLHENYGDVDSHLPLFTGPVREYDGGIRALIERFEHRGLEDFAFALLSEAANRFEDAAAAGSWEGLLQVLALALSNVRLSRIEPEEISVLESELAAWAPDLAGGPTKTDRLALPRIKSTLERAERLAEGYTDRVLSLFPGRVTSLGRSLNVASHAIAVFCEGDIRGNIVFQLSKLVGMLRKGVRTALGLSPWETVVPAEIHGLLVEADTLSALVQRAEGDKEIPTGVRGILLGHAIPQLSHLGVSARQASIAFAAAGDRQLLETLKGHLGKRVRLRVGADELSLQESESPAETLDVAPEPQKVELPEARLTKTPSWVPAIDATSETCGAKGAGAGRLLELAEESEGMFATPQALVLPFGVMEYCLTHTFGLKPEYRALQQRLADEPDTRLDEVLEGLRELIERIVIPSELLEAIGDTFGNVSTTAMGSLQRIRWRSSA